MNIEEIETLAFTNDRPCHMSQRQAVHQPRRAIWENVATENCILQLWLMTEPSEVWPISHQHSAILIMLKYLIRLGFFLCCCFPSFFLTRKSFAEICKIAKTSMGKILFWWPKKIYGTSFFLFPPATLLKDSWMATFLWS